jgi:hypothetical protein
MGLCRTAKAMLRKNLCGDCTKKGGPDCQFKDVHPLAHACDEFSDGKFEYPDLANTFTVTVTESYTLVEPTKMPSSGKPVLK